MIRDSDIANPFFVMPIRTQNSSYNAFTFFKQFRSSLLDSLFPADIKNSSLELKDTKWNDVFAKQEKKGEYILVL